MCCIKCDFQIEGRKTPGTDLCIRPLYAECSASRRIAIDLTLYRKLSAVRPLTLCSLQDERMVTGHNPPDITPRSEYPFSGKAG